MSQKKQALYKGKRYDVLRTLNFAGRKLVVLKGLDAKIPEKELEFVEPTAKAKETEPKGENS